jgi:hypothetical protein
MEGVLSGLHLNKALYSCGFEEPCRWLQCGFYPGKVNRKSLISTIFLGFYAIFAGFCLKAPIFSGFCAFASQILKRPNRRTQQRAGQEIWV